MTQNANVVESEGPVKPRWDRGRVAQLLQELQQSSLSLEAFAKLHDVPPQTIRYWQKRQSRIDDDPQVVAFMESPAGVRYLHQLQVAAHLHFHWMGNCGVDVISDFFDACGLWPYLACSHGAQYAFGKEMEAEIVAYGNQQRQLLGSQMPAKSITLAEDETFHPQICLVAIEPVSNFIVLEQYAQQRDASTWTGAVQEAISDLNVEVIQVTSDAARGLIAHAKKDLQVHHPQAGTRPDLFHLQQDLCCAFFASLRADVREVEIALEKKQQEKAAWQAKQQQAEIERSQGQKPPGRPVDYESRITCCELLVQAWEEEKTEREDRSEQVRQKMQELKDAYHPFDLETGASRKTAAAKKQLTSCVDELESKAKAWELPDRSHKRLAKVRRALPKLWETIAWFWWMVKLWLLPFSLNLGQRHPQAGTRAERLISYHYLTPGTRLRVAEKAASPEERRALVDLAATQRQQAFARDGPFGQAQPSWLEELDQTARRCAELFQRSSSCVEGRNGQLSLDHHSFHRLDGGQLSALTVLHNYYVHRADGTTAAERFFEAPPEDLFAWLLERLPYPSRGAARRTHREEAVSSQAA